MHHAIVVGRQDAEGIGIEGENGGTDQEESNDQLPGIGSTGGVAHSDGFPVEAASPSPWGVEDSSVSIQTPCSR